MTKLMELLGLATIVSAFCIAIAIIIVSLGAALVLAFNGVW